MMNANRADADERNSNAFPADGPWHANHEMRLRSDGNLPGQLRAFDAAGNLAPVRARLFFLQNGKLVGKANADDTGHFQAVGLTQGVYSVVVASPEGFGAFSVKIDRDNESIPPPKVKSIAKVQPLSPLTLDVSLIPPSDFQLTAQIMQEQMPGVNFGPPATPFGGGMGGGAGAGGGGGGGGGGAGMAAALGLGGLGAALLSKQNQSTASSGS
jgi:hypothetical protein